MNHNIRNWLNHEKSKHQDWYGSMCRSEDNLCNLNFLTSDLILIDIAHVRLE